MAVSFKLGRKLYSKRTEDFLANIFQEEEEKDNLVRLMDGTFKTLKVKEANAVLRMILLAIIINDGVDDIEFIPDINPVINEDLPEDESLSQLNKALNPAAGSSNIANIPAGSKSSVIPKSDQAGKKDGKNTTLCRFYKNGRCKKGLDCRFEHPKICNKFRQFGDIKHNEKGCKDPCNLFHPNVCRDSQRNKTCKWSECRFFHLKGTKKLNENQSQNRFNNNSHSSQSISTRNRFEPLAEKPSPEIDQSALSKTLAKIMEEIADLRAGQNKNTQSKNSNQADWRNKPDMEEEESHSLRDQRKRWGSPNNYRNSQGSQRSQYR